MSEALIPVVVIGSVIALIALVALVNAHYAKKRREAWQAVAQQLGLTFLPDAQGVRDQLGEFKVCNIGRSRVACNALVGARSGFDVMLFDYRYTTGSGKSSHTYHLSLCAVRHQALRLPRFFLRRQLKLWDALGKLFGGQDINFDEDAAFSRSFVLQGADEVAVRRAFSDHARGYFLKYQDSALQFEANGDALLINSGRRLDPGQGREFIDQAINIARIWTE